MSTRWYNLSDTDLLTWLNNFSGKLSATPLVFHITTEQAGTMAGLVSVFENKLSIWREPSSNSRTASLAKKAARIAVIEGAKNLVSAITTNPLTTDEQRGDLGIPLKVSPSPVPVPSEEPEIDILSVTGRKVNARIHGASIEHRRKPAGCAGAYIWTFAGETTPSDLDAWAFWGNTTKTLFEVEFDASVEAGTKVWLCAGWVNAKGQVGPVCDPVSTYTQFGGMTLTVAKGAKKAA